MLDWKQVLGALHEGVVVTKPSSEIVWANEAYCALTGYPLDELVGRTPAILRSPSTTPRDIELLWDNLRTAGRTVTRLSNRRRDGTIFLAELAFAKLAGADAEPLFVCSMRDVTLEAKLAKRLEQARVQAEQSRDVTIESLASLTERRDRSTGSHLLRIESYVRVMATWLLARRPEAFPKFARDAATIGRCSILHDIGKVGIPDAILLKAGPLDAAEQRVMMEHPRIGAEILDRVIAQQRSSAFLRVARDIVAFHHEAWNGSGYPHGLAGDAIPVHAQLTTVADVFDALTSHRPYKPAHRFEDAVAYLRREAGVRLSPLAVEAFLATLDEQRSIYERLGDPPSDEPIRPSGIIPTRVTPVPPAPAPPPRESRLLEVLGEAFRDAEGGEIVVRSGSTVGRIFVWRERIAWIETNVPSGSLAAELHRQLGVLPYEVEAVISDCKTSGKDFTRALIDSRLVAEAGLRRVMRDLLALRLDLIRAFEEPVAMFVPVHRAYEGGFTFSLAELGLDRPLEAA